MKKWITAPGDKSRAPELAKRLGIPVITAAMLLVKGFANDGEMLRFLSDESELSDPFLILDMDKAVQRIELAIEKGEKICVYGDYDADGVTSTSIMYLYLRSIWCDVVYYIPDREKEGYGMNNAAVEKLHEEGVTLIITVDNGISAFEQVRLANSLGIDTIVTDHHEPPERLPEAIAILDPHRDGDESPFKFFSGVGVAFKLIMALERQNLDLEDLFDRYADICAIGTVADVVSLTGENRVLVREGLKRINAGANLGIQTLRRLSGIDGRDVTSGDIGFIIAPRINAGGRINRSQKAVELFITDDEERAQELASELCKNNDERKQIEKEIIEASLSKLANDESISSRKVIVVAGEGWRQGVIGLAAARIKEVYGKPTIVISYEGDSAKGSARSVEGFSMIAGITYCQSLLTIFGGHPMAAGMSLPTENIGKFREMINEYADQNENDFFPCLTISAWVRPGLLTVGDLESLSKLEPYGTGNPKPVFGYGAVTITDVSPLKGGQYLKVLFKKGDTYGAAVNFGSTFDDFPYQKGDEVNLAVDVKTNEYNGVVSVSSMLRDIKFTSDDNEKLLRSKQLFEEYLTGKPVTDDMRRELSVTREGFAAVYRYLKKSGGFRYSSEILLHRIGDSSLTLGRLLIILRAMEQLGLITTSPDAAKLNIKVTENPTRVDIFKADILQRLNG